MGVRRSFNRSMNTSLDTDIELLVGTMEPVPCDHHEHGMPGRHHGGEGRWYAIMRCPSCERKSPVLALCQPLVTHYENGGRIYCIKCETVMPGKDMMNIVGPITQ